MMSTRSKYKSSFGFIDVLFNLLVGVTLMFFLAFLLINPIAKKKDIEAKAEYFVIIEWHDKSYNDVDIWVKDNKQHVVSFRARDVALMHLDRDDLGDRNDTYHDPDTGKIVRVYGNREVVSIRGKDHRTYTVSVHLYMLSEQSISQEEEVRIELLRVNPYKIIKVKKVVLNGRGDERHVFEFEVNEDDPVTVKETGKLIVNSEENVSGYLGDPGEPHPAGYMLETTDNVSEGEKEDNFGGQP